LVKCCGSMCTYALSPESHIGEPHDIQTHNLYRRCYRFRQTFHRVRILSQYVCTTELCFQVVIRLPCGALRQALNTQQQPEYCVHLLYCDGLWCGLVVPFHLCSQLDHKAGLASHNPINYIFIITIILMLQGQWFMEWFGRWARISGGCLAWCPSSDG
jgi:hypothetical protein